MCIRDRTGGGAVADGSTPGTGASSGPAGTATSADFDRLEPFEGDHQHGVASAPQAHATLLALDLLPGAGKEDLRRLLTVWTDDIRRLTQGRPTLSDPQPELDVYKRQGPHCGCPRRPGWRSRG